MLTQRRIALAAPKGHQLSKLKKLRLRNLVDASFIRFPRRESPAFYDRLMHECFRGGLKTPRLVQETVNEATILSLVSHGLGVGFVNGTARWRCPESLVILSVTDLNMPLPLALVWRKDNVSALLARFVADVRLLPEVQGLARQWSSEIVSAGESIIDFRASRADSRLAHASEAQPGHHCQDVVTTEALKPRDIRSDRLCR